MTKHILIIEPDPSFKAALVRELKKLGAYRISTVTTLKAACLTLIQENQDVVFLPAIADDRPLRALLALQSDLRLVVTTSQPEISLPPAVAAKVHGVLLKTYLETALPGILALIFEEPCPESTSWPGLTVHKGIQTGTLGPRLQSAVLLYGRRPVTHWGQLTKAETAQVAEMVGTGWIDNTKTTQIQFIRFPERGAVSILYTRLIAQEYGVEDLPGNYLLTLVAAPEISLGWLRVRAGKLATSLAHVVKNEAAIMAYTEGGAGGKQENGRISYALAWRPCKLLPYLWHIPIRRALERLAAAYACILTYIEVKPHLIHLVVTCPPGRPSSWVVSLLKNGSEETIRQEYGVQADLWDTSYFAAESSRPLSAQELSGFLKRV